MDDEKTTAAMNGTERRAPWPADRPQWLTPWPGTDGTTIDLVCLPFAGGGSAAYTPWRPLVKGRGVALLPVCLPGREQRIGEPAFDRMDPLVRALCAAIAPRLTRPFALFGHSMGAIVAYEAARHLTAVFGKTPVHLFVSGHRAPMLPDNHHPVHALPTDALIAHLRTLGGMRPEVLENQDLLDLVLPTLRADFALCATYRHRAGPPLDCPVTVLAGVLDWRAPPETMAGWAGITRAPCTSHVFPGGHFFIDSERNAVVGCVLDTLAAERAGKEGVMAPAPARQP